MKKYSVFFLIFLLFQSVTQAISLKDFVAITGPTSVALVYVWMNYKNVQKMQQKTVADYREELDNHIEGKLRPGSMWADSFRGEVEFLKELVDDVQAVLVQHGLSCKGAERNCSVNMGPTGVEMGTVTVSCTDGIYHKIIPSIWHMPNRYSNALHRSARIKLFKAIVGHECAHIVNGDSLNGMRLNLFFEPFFKAASISFFLYSGDSWKKALLKSFGLYLLTKAFRNYWSCYQEQRADLGATSDPEENRIFARWLYQLGDTDFGSFLFDDTSIILEMINARAVGMKNEQVIEERVDTPFYKKIPRTLYYFLVRLVSDHPSGFERAEKLIQKARDLERQ